MPIKLIPPRQGFSPYYYGRGTYLGIFVNRSTQSVRPAIAKRVIKGWETDIERGRFETKAGPTFMSAAVAYMNAGGEKRPVAKLIAHFGDKPLRPKDLGPDETLDQHWQDAIAAAAAALFPTHAAATRNREVYTPMSAILKGAGLKFGILRPTGSRGRELTGWLQPDEAERMFKEGSKLDAEFGTLLVFLCYTGCRLSEALKLKCDDLRIATSEALIRQTKNGDPRNVFLPEVVVAALANHPRGLEREGERVFRYAKSGRLYELLAKCAKAAKIAMPDREAFHIFRHTYATWMRRFAGADAKTLVGTGAWRSEQSASRYAHTIVSEESKRASMLPVGKSKAG